MNKKNFLAIFAAVICLLTTASCDKTADYEPGTVQLPGCFAVATDLATGETTVTPKFTLLVMLDYINNLATVQLSDLNLPGEDALSTLRFNNIPYTTDQEGWINIVSARFDAVAELISPEISNLKLSYLPRYFDNMLYPGMCMRFLVDGKYAVECSLTDYYLAGTTKVENGVESFETKIPTYYAALDFGKMTCSLGLFNVKFKEDSYTYSNMVLRGIPMTFTNGMVSFGTEALTPEVDGNAAPQWPVTDISGTLYIDNGALTLSYTITPGTTDTYTISTSCDLFALPPVYE